ncbi:uncharacterized protein si:cabz01007807.1 [Hippocampus zosterae]|uniref:uncharacterized protein si:cabz01007807.1 n=1 Tax=Hippocampus zosterae TaxID=109293 RepID=UPI00223E2369|nr:uncharacterized protein si:cabz01007807.1 [Hippocampus zosterae]
MRAVVSTEDQEGAKDEQGESDTIQRRPSIVVLQNMLRKIPPSPFHNSQQSVRPSPSSGSPASVSRSNRDDFLNVTTDSQLSQDAAQRPNPQPVASTNPFYSYQLESRHKYDTSEDVGQKPWQEERTASDLFPLPEFRRSPLDWQENGPSGSEDHKDRVRGFSSNHLPDNIFTSQIGQDQNTSRSLLQDSPEDFSLTASSGNVSDPFRPFSNTAEDPIGSPEDPSGNPFYSFQASAGKFSPDDKLASSGLSGSDLDVFSPSSNVSSSIVKELFGDGGGASEPLNPEAANDGDVFGSLPRSGLTKSTWDLSEHAVPWPYPDGPRDVALTAPQGSKHGILHPTPFSQAQKLSASSDSSPTESNHVTLSRRPPKPLPRSRPPRLEKPPVPDKSRKPAYIVEPEPSGPPKPPPKPVKASPVSFAGAAAMPQDGKELDKEHCDIFEDILLIGQEKCVEDWPEDSPQFHPDFKPSGKFRLRRESLTVTQISEEGATRENRDDFGGHVKKKDRKFLLLSRGGSKDKVSDDMKDGRSLTLPSQGKSSKETFYEMNYPSGKREDGEQSWSDGKKKPLKNKVNQLLRRASTSLVQRQAAPASKDDDFLQKRMNMKESAMRWHSQEAMFDFGKGDEDEAARAQLDEADAFAGKGKKKMKKKFGHLKGLTHSQGEQPQGAHGYTPRKDSKDREEQFFAGAGMWQEHSLENVDELKGLHSISQEDVPFFHPHQNSFPAEQLDYEAPDAADAYAAKKNKFKAPVPLPRKPKPSFGSPAPVEAPIFGDAAFAPTCQADNWSDEDHDALSERQHGDPVVDYYYKQDELVYQKPKKLKRKPFRKHKSKNKAWEGAVEEVPINHLSEAAQAEWLAAQRDERVAAGLEYGEGDGDGDTDSLMEWWYTVEKWYEVPSDEETKQRDDSESFTVLADKVNRGLRVFNKVFMERAEVFWQHVVKLHALADHLSTFHQKAKAAGITGNTTAAVGGVTAIAGLALAPFTFGASLIVTAVGVGVATAGGITSASASISDNVNIMQERKKVEAVLQEYEFDFRGLADILHFVNHGLYKLRGHPFLRSGTQHYSEDWEVRKAVQMISLVDSPVMRAMEVTDAILRLVQGLHGGMEKYFKDSRNLKRAFKKQVVARIKEAANVLNDGVVELNAIREELQKAVGNF